jgi:hypothetical protein
VLLNEDALLKLLLLRVLDIFKKRTKPIPNWILVRAQLDLICSDGNI